MYNTVKICLWPYPPVTPLPSLPLHLKTLFFWSSFLFISGSTSSQNTFVWSSFPSSLVPLHIKTLFFRSGFLHLWFHFIAKHSRSGCLFIVNEAAKGLASIRPWVTNASLKNMIFYILQNHKLNKKTPKKRKHNKGCDLIMASTALQRPI